MASLPATCLAVHTSGLEAFLAQHRGLLGLLHPPACRHPLQTHHVNNQI